MGAGVGVVVFEDDPDVDVFLVVRPGPVFGCHVVDDEFGGQVFGDFGADGVDDFLECFRIGGHGLPASWHVVGVR